MNKKITQNLIGSLVLIATMVVLSTGVVYAKSKDNCESHYGGGKTCLVNKRFKIEKWVKVKGDDSWKDKVTDVDEDDTILFKIKIKNLSDDEGDFDFDNMKMKDFLPDELERIGGDGLTEEWDDFEPGEERTFEIEAEIDEDEFDRDDDFEKCVVNKAEVRWDGEFEGADTATVCYGDEEPKELPKTGSVPFDAITGVGLITAGLVLKKFRK